MLDVLVIGSGGAGLSAALAAKEAGAEHVAIASKFPPMQTQTTMAQGGMNAALGNLEKDHIALHIDDTLKAGRGLCDEEMVRLMCSEAPQSVAWLEKLGVPFSRIKTTENEALSTIAQRYLGGASVKRACYAQDYTGLKILHTLYDQTRKYNIIYLYEYFLLDLIVEDGYVRGVLFWDIAHGEVRTVIAKSVILATGGFGAMYHNHTTNMYGTSGDGIAAAFRAGAMISDMEFVQFHPTGLYGSNILISESARGEGGYLVDQKGERFVDELAPRDVVVHAIYEQMNKGNRIYLDLRHLGKEKLESLLPQELALIRLHENIDPVFEPIPIKPVVHYTMGGIDIDKTMEIPTIKGCFAVGECANSKVHGANRLGGNSLLEIIAFGRIVGENATNYTHYVREKSIDKDYAQRAKDDIDNIFVDVHKPSFYSLRQKLGECLYQNVGIIRDEFNLQQALQEVTLLQASLSKYGIGDSEFKHNQALTEYLELRNMLMLAPAFISAALVRQESRGAHYRKDYPKMNDKAFLKHIRLHYQGEMYG
ncbi:MAG: FAD-binding protein [Sulfurovum sp.]|nr:FAD-binding protein [Sulfurovum sp.]MCB4751351.1 FAD-binding protein [Sulfurovum sp.]MCB4760677.1 FAD-binding protein [Sulfurovum sp.]